MIEIAIMIEGQNGLNWPRWQRSAKAVEDLGFVGLYRSDHYTNASPPDLDSLELWVSLTWLACSTEQIEFGPLVSPVSFRDPTMTARMASAVDDLSGGRLVLGLGAGWQEREHNNFGWDLLSIEERFNRLQEALEVISRLMQCKTPVDFEGKYYRLEEAIMLPKPIRVGGPPILIGGNGPIRTLPLVVRYASEWNAVYIPADEFRKLNADLDQLLVENGREPSDVKRSLMTGCIFAPQTKQVKEKVTIRTEGKFSPEELREQGFVVGTTTEIQEQLGELDGAGVQRVMLQWLDLDDIDGLEALAKGIL